MTKPDYLWRNVSATISPYLRPGEEDSPEKYVMFRMDLTDRGQYFYHQIIANVRDLRDAPGTYKFILDDMVKAMDKSLEEKGHRNPVPHMDHRALLRKYMEHVGQAEGVTFVNNHERHAYPGFPIFTDREWHELRQIANEDYTGPRVT